MRHAVSMAVLMASFTFAASCAAQPQASQHGTVSQTVNTTTITLEYDRPVLRGRSIFGELLDYDVVWTPGANRATWKDQPLELTYCEFEILALLASRPGRVASYRDLCEAIDSSVTENTIATHVQHVRNKFQRVDREFPRTRAIRAVTRRGYAWETPPDCA